MLIGHQVWEVLAVEVVAAEVAHNALVTDVVNQRNDVVVHHQEEVAPSAKNF